METNNIIKENQAGFRSGYSTTDHIFVLHALIEILKRKKDNLGEFYEYTKQWKLDINFSKSEVLVFGTRNDDGFSFKLGPNELSICKEFKYLGVTFSKKQKFL